MDEWQAANKIIVFTYEVCSKAFMSHVHSIRDFFRCSHLKNGVDLLYSKAPPNGELCFVRSFF